MSDAIYQAASDNSGKSVRKNDNWFDAGIEEMEPDLAAKGAALLNNKRNPCEKTLTAFRETRNNAKMAANRCVSDTWLKLSSDI
jgi:hypothetical protein